MSREREEQNEDKKTSADEDLDETQDGDEPVEGSAKASRQSR
jgi:hypothetical protein